jgi:Na+-transporting methylmalonyl-CoA/oxaloacetate decarboxylase gamma subunit
MIVGTYLTYLLISITATVFVGRTLHKNGRIFLVDSFHGNAALADSVNHLLVVGFYLINVGFVSLALKYGERAVTLEQAIEILSTKIGIVLLVLGVMHFFNIRVISAMRRRAVEGVRPPVRPQHVVTPPVGA